MLRRAREPRNCARLFVALVAEAALLEMPTGAPDPQVRRAVAEFLDRTVAHDPVGKGDPA